MRLKRNHALTLFLVSYGMIAHSLYQFLLVLPPSKILGDSYRLFFLHIPTPIVGFLAFTVTLVCSIAYLRTGDMKWDDIASGSVKLGFLFSGLAIATGWAFSYEAWNTTWSWDPKVVTIFILWFIYMGYFVLRQATYEPIRRARASAVYGIIAYLSVPLTYLSTRVWTTLHPEGSVGLTPAMGLTAVLMVAGFTLLYLYLLWFEVNYKRLLKVYETTVGKFQ